MSGVFVRNNWYAAAWCGEIGPGEPLARTVIGERLVLFRGADGAVAALEDRCAHRSMPLSLGRVADGGRLICPYHGLAYDAAGACVHVPGQDDPGKIRIRAYPVEERAGLVFVWMGPPGRADAALLPDCSWLERPGWHRTDLYRRAEANYLLLNDNLADLLHVAFLHMPSGGGNADMGDAELSLDVNEAGYDFQRHSRDIPAPEGYRRLSNAQGNIDRWHVVQFHGPCFWRIHTGVAETGSGGPASGLPAGAGRWANWPHHFVTPETETSTHYFQSVAHETPPSDESRRFLESVIEEDVWAIQHQQQALDRYPDIPLQTIASDEPTIAMRAIVGKMAAAEGAGAR